MADIITFISKTADGAILNTYRSICHISYLGCKKI